MTDSDLEAFWAEVLSGDAVRARVALDALEASSRASVLEHLRRMAREPGWTGGQRERARTALEAASSPPRPDNESSSLEHGS